MKSNEQCKKVGESKWILTKLDKDKNIFCGLMSVELKHVSTIAFNSGRDTEFKVL